MKKLIIIGAFCVLQLLLAGCYLGDRVGTGRTVSVQIREATWKDNLSTNAPAVQEALRIIEATLVSEGLTRDTNPPVQAEQEQGLIASYARYNGTGPRPIDGPRVYLKGDKLQVFLFEHGNRSGRPSPSTKRLSDLLRKDLAKQPVK